MLGRFRVRSAALALPYRPLVECDSEPREIAEDRLLPALDRSRRVGVVDPEHEHPALRVGEAPVGDGRQGVPDVEGARRAGSEADAD
jgi:hypothetical protein